MSIGKIEEFNIRDKNWESYITRMKQYLKVNNVHEKLHTATLIAVVGGEAFELMVDLCNHEKPENKKFHELVKLMQDHLHPQPSEIAERYKFRQRKQEEGESIAAYVASLKKLVKNCKFSEKLDEHLRDQLVFGLRSEGIRQLLFAEVSLTYSYAYQLAITMEAMEVNADLIAGSSTTMDKKPSTLSALERKPPVATQEKKKCWHCGKYSHQENNCAFRYAQCNLCRKRGHISTICKGRARVNVVTEELAGGLRRHSDQINVIQGNNTVRNPLLPRCISNEMKSKLGNKHRVHYKSQEKLNFDSFDLCDLYD